MQSVKSGRVTHFWRYIVGCAAECFGSLVTRNVLLAHAKIGDFHMSIGIEQHVIQLQIAIENALGMQIEQACSDFGSIKAVDKVNNVYWLCKLVQVGYLHGDWLFELAKLLYLKHQIAAVDILHDKEQTILRKKI